MLIKTLTVGQLDTNCYIVINEATLECVVIDPGDESNTILDYIEDNKLVCKAVLITHGHMDHTGAVQSVIDETGAKVYMNKRDNVTGTAGLPYFYDLPENGISYDDGNIFVEAGLTFGVLSTPGHTPGSVALICENAIFSGDTLFRGSCGRTDLYGGNIEDLMHSLKKICSLSGDYEVYPGHMASTSLIREKTLNFYCRKAISDY